MFENNEHYVTDVANILCLFQTKGNEVGDKILKF